MGNDIIDSVTEDMLTIPPLIGRSIRRKLLKTAFTIINNDISPLHFAIMKALEEVGTLHVAEIGERLQIPRPQMTHLIDRLVNQDMVERRADPADRRAINIALTDKGKTMIKEHRLSAKASIKATLSCLDDEDLKELSLSLRKLRDIFSKLA